MMLPTWVDALSRIQDIVFENIAPDQSFSFETFTGRDYSGLVKGSLFEQNNDFVVFEADVDTIRRAGPSKVSPSRAWGVLSISLHTKDQDNNLAQLGRLDVFSDWFAEKTVKDIRFRTFIPSSTSRVMGFLSFSGVLSFEYEIQPKDSTL